MTYKSFDSSEKVVCLTERMTLLPATKVCGHAYVIAPPVGGVSFGIGEEEGQQPSLLLNTFQVSEPPVELTLSPTTDTQAKAVAWLEYQPHPESDDIAVLLHEIHTPDGIVYDITLPQPTNGAISFRFDEQQVPSPLLFPINNLVHHAIPHTQDVGAVSYGLANSITEAAKESTKHMLYVLKTPVNQSLKTVIAQQETPRQVVLIDRNGEPGHSIVGAEGWRSRFNPAQAYRVLLFIHGFCSSVEAALPRAWMRDLVPSYDAVLAYNHPTICFDPFQNATDLLAMIPEDMRLNVDIVAHSRGGLVARSLVELLPPTPKCNIQRLVSFGTPHAGSPLAQRQRWDRLVSMILTTANWLAATTGSSSLMFIPSLLEYLLSATSQCIFDLPGAEALDPDSTFLQRLNAPNDSSLTQRVAYAAVSSTFDPRKIAQHHIGQSLFAMATQSFHGVPNDLIVPTASMRTIDPGTQLLATNAVFQTDVNHFCYFEREEVKDFTVAFLRGSLGAMSFAMNPTTEQPHPPQEKQDEHSTQSETRFTPTSCALLHKWALITGASSGIGTEFARQLAAYQCNLILVARREERLKALQQELAPTYGITVKVISIDLSEVDAPQRLYDQITKDGIFVEILINNAGFGNYGEFVNIPWERERDMFALNIIALVHMTKLFVRDMVNHNSGYIVQVASIGAYQPTPWLASYAATKSFVRNFSEAINYELRKTNVSCTVVSPGFTATEFADVSGGKGNILQRLAMMKSEDVAKIGIDSMLKRKASVVTGRMNACGAFLTRLVPRRVAAAIAEIFMRE